MPSIKVLLDENMPKKNFLSNPKYEVIHVETLGLKETQNGDLLNSAAARGFDVLITNDLSIEREQNHRMHSLPLGILVVTTKDFLGLKRLEQTISRALDLIKKCQYATLETKLLPKHGYREHTRGTLDFAKNTNPPPTAQQLKDAHRLPGFAAKELSHFAAVEHKRRTEHDL